MIIIDVIIINCSKKGLTGCEDLRLLLRESLSYPEKEYHALAAGCG